MNGYSHPNYINSFSSIGSPLFLPKCRGWLIERPIPKTQYFDAMGPYPLFFCEDWHSLVDDLESMQERLVRVTFAIGRFSDILSANYQEYFDFFRPYKDDYYYDSTYPLKNSISKNNKKNARKALKSVSVDLVTSPDINLDEWCDLYENLIKRHAIKGIRAFSRESFAHQISIPDTLFFRARHQGRIVGGNLFYVQDEVAYGHLMAQTDEGYQLGAAHAIKWVALDYLTSRVKYINFGGATGENQGEMTGLDKFKQGWTNKIGKSHFCGKILNQRLYSDLTMSNSCNDGNWFPAYRSTDY